MLKLKEDSGLTKEQNRELIDIRTQIAWCEDVLGQMSKMAKRLRRDSNLGARFTTRTFDSYEFKDGDESAYKICKAYASGIVAGIPQDRNGLILFGKNGIGKTHLAAAIANEVIEAGIPTIFTTFSDLLNAEREAMTSNSSRLEEYKNIPLLVIDDLGKEKQTEWAKEKLFQIVNHRYEDMLPTIITTNMSAEEFSKMDEAIVGRLIETCEVINVQGKNRRT